MAKLVDFNPNGIASSILGDMNISREIAKEILPPAAEDFKQMIISNAEAEFSSSQGSILEHIRNIGVGGLEETGSGYSIGLSLSGGLSRPSLNPNNGGAYDIVGLFINGWLITTRAPWGEWHGMKVGARKVWGGMGFLSSAVEEFNAKYAGLGIYATAGY